MICTFIGSHNCGSNIIRNKLEIEIEKLILLGVNVFYSGGYGEFDSLVLHVVGELSTKYNHIKNYLIVPYHESNLIEKYEFSIKKYKIELLYPFESRVMPRFAILKRNEWMINNADIVISHAGFGGSYTALEYAKHKNKQIIYI